MRAQEISAAVPEAEQDKFSALLSNAQFAVAITANDTHVRLDELDFTCQLEDVRRDCEKHDRAFIGVVALVDGKPRSAFVDEVSDETTAIIARKFPEMLLNRLKRPRWMMTPDRNWN
jgi:hypothetical protein